MKKITFNRDGFTENRIGFDYADLTEDVKQKVIQEHSEFLIQTAESEEEAQFDTNYVIEHIEINGYLFDEDGDLLPIVTHVGKNNEVLKHTFGKNNYECNITDFFSDYPIQDDIWPSRRWNKARTEYIDLSGTTPVKETEPAPTPTSKEGLEDGGFTKGEWNSDLHDGNVYSGGIVVANCYSSLLMPATIKANAELIVKAVNNFPAMYEALKDCLKCLTMDSDMEEDFAPEIKKAKTILTRINKD